MLERVTDALQRDRSRAARRPETPSRARRAIVIAGSALVLVGVLVAAIVILAPQPSPPTPVAAVPATAVPAPTLSPSPPPPFDTEKYSIDDADSYWVVVNKARPLDPQDYEADDLETVPIVAANSNDQLREEAADALGAMADAYENDTGDEIQAQSAYRSFNEQTGVYAGWVSSLGQKAADLTSARPGHSEHQTGWAVDISSVPPECSLVPCFGKTQAGKWLKKNSWEYGFIVRYPDGETDITGYEYEPYHMRYVGLELAAEMRETGISTMEEFFGLDAAPDYLD
jgi:D-alanyl-D-alanine carboxypeptidase